MSGTVSENPKKAFGALKPCAHYAPMNVMDQVYRVFELGAKKYGLKNWRKQPVDASTYYDAAYRHLTTWFERREDTDPESEQSHLAHVVACCLIIMDGLEQDAFTDDRGRTEVLTGSNAEYPEYSSRLTEETLKWIVRNRAEAANALEAALKPQTEPLREERDREVRDKF